MTALTFWAMWSFSATTGAQWELQVFWLAAPAVHPLAGMVRISRFQRAYLLVLFCRACVRAHKLALMAQRQFWSSLLRNSVRLVDLQVRPRLVDSAAELPLAILAMMHR